MGHGGGSDEEESSYKEKQKGELVFPPSLEKNFDSGRGESIARFTKIVFFSKAQEGNACLVLSF